MSSDETLLNCPHCGNRTPHIERLRHEFKGIWYDDQGRPSQREDSPPIHYRVFECRTCHDLSLYQGFDGDSDTEWLAYPHDTQLDVCVPASVSANYSEAKRIQKTSPNAFAVLLRRALEAVCDDRGVKKGVLQKRLQELSANGEIPAKLTDMTEILRELGNAGAHNSLQSVTVPQTWSMDQFFQTIIEYVYVAPRKLQEFKESLKKAKEQPND